MATGYRKTDCYGNNLRILHLLSNPLFWQSHCTMDINRSLRNGSLPVVLSFAAVYIIWGSTFYAILVGIETIPPFLLAAVRFLLAGAVLYGFERLRGVPSPSWIQWRWAALLGGLLMFGGNGFVTWAEQLVPSGMAALMIATIPVWMVALDAMFYGGDRPHGWVWVALAIAVVGVGVLAEPGEGAIAPLGALLLVLASFSWANGSLLTRRAALPDSPWMTASMQMLTGGAILLIAATATGEWSKLDPSAVTMRSLLAMLYLAFFGSIVAHSAYVYLLRVRSAASVSTYAFVNPMIALAIGWVFGETLGWRALVGAALIVGAVLLIHAARHRSVSTTSPSDRPAPRHTPEHPSRENGSVRRKRRKVA